MPIDSPLLITFVVLASAVVLALGAVIVHLAYRAYRRTGSPVLGMFAAGFAIVTVGLGVGGGLYHGLGLSFAVGLLVQRVLAAVGFSLLVYSLYAQLPDDPGRVP